ncbi:MAG: AraC family transcriptional regulator [Bacteroidales bacterium]|nr:AraC family transcriptional regulator [Bacteroidales bacterium]MDD4770016.1 AraC family transcriptional regulator [Bacteroidales bacterium]
MSDLVYLHSTPYLRETLRIGNMLCKSCLKVVEDILIINNIQIKQLEMGQAEVLINQQTFDRNSLNRQLQAYDMFLIHSSEEQLVDDTKKAVVDLIHRMNNVNSIVQKSDYLVERLGVSYQKLSRLFSKHEGMTLEKYIIQHKIERIKQLINEGEFSLSEIAYMMDYSSVQYLSNQFKKHTGLSVRDYRSKNNI